YLPGVRVVAAAVAGQRRGAAVGLYVAAFYLGSALSLGATGLLLGAGDWRRAALALGAASALSVPLGLGLGGAAPPGPDRSAGRQLEAAAEGRSRAPGARPAGGSTSWPTVRSAGLSSPTPATPGSSTSRAPGWPPSWPGCWPS